MDTATTKQVNTCNCGGDPAKCNCTTGTCVCGKHTAGDSASTCNCGGDPANCTCASGTCVCGAHAASGTSAGATSTKECKATCNCEGECQAKLKGHPTDCPTAATCDCAPGTCARKAKGSADAPCGCAGHSAQCTCAPGTCACANCAM